MIRFVIFDVDGTLLDSVDLHARAWQETLREFGHELAFEDVREQIGKGGDQLLPVFLGPDELAKCEKEISQRRSAIFKERAQTNDFPFFRMTQSMIVPPPKPQINKTSFA